jgi:bacillithiol biosynthesis cysteine-adding enzyme BshC
MAGSFHSSHLAGGMRADAFLPLGLGDPADRRRAVEQAAQRRTAPELVELLRAQNGRDADELARPGTVVVATGQQVGLFLGPLYTLYKAAGAVALARTLERETGVRAVPLFWLQTEDHDFVEIATCRVGARNVGLTDDPALARVSIAHRTLGPEVGAQLDALGEELVGLPFADEVFALLREHYRPGAPVARAFAGVLRRLFAREGLIVFDPRQPAVARLSAPVIRRALVEHEALEARLVARGEALRAAGFPEQIALRAGSPLVFFHAGTPQGPRHRLLRAGEWFRVSGTNEALTCAQAIALATDEPMRFSTSALLRPIVQDALFPVAAYVGGPAELDYFAQATALYGVFELPAPLVAHRPRFRLLTAPVRRLLEELRLVPADLDRGDDALQSKLAGRHGVDPHAPSPSWASELEHRLDLLDQRAPDPGLRRAADRTRHSVRRALERLERRYRRLALERERTTHDRLERLRDWLRPDGAPQERVHSFAPFAARTGVDAFVRAVVDAVDPLDPSLKDLEL